MYRGKQLTAIGEDNNRSKRRFGLEVDWGLGFWSEKTAGSLFWSEVNLDK